MPSNGYDAKSGAVQKKRKARPMVIHLDDIEGSFARYEETDANATDEERWITEPTPWSELEELLNRNRPRPA